MAWPEKTEVVLTLNGNGSVDAVTTQGDEPRDQTRLVFTMAIGFMYRLRSPANVEPGVEAGFASALEKSTRCPRVEAATPGQTARQIRQMDDDSRSLDSQSFDDLLFENPDPYHRAFFACNRNLAWMTKASRPHSPPRWITSSASRCEPRRAGEFPLPPKSPRWKIIPLCGICHSA